MTTFISPPMTVWIWMLFSFLPRVFDLLSSSLIPRPLSLTWFFESSVWEMSVYLFLHPSLVGRRRRRRRTSFWNILKFLGNRKRERDKSLPGCVVIWGRRREQPTEQNLAETGEKNGDGMICNVKKKKELVGWRPSSVSVSPPWAEFERRVMDADTFGGEDEFAAFRPRASPKKKPKTKRR